VPPELAELYGFIKAESKRVAKEIADDFLQAKASRGKLIFVQGPLFSGKSSVILYLAKLLASRPGLVIAQPKLDRPDMMNDFIQSWDGEKTRATSYTHAAIPQLTSQAKLLVLDEVMFTPYGSQSLLLKEIEMFVERGGWVVTIGLLYNGFGGRFLMSEVLVSRADTLYTLYSVCQKCGNKRASIGQRFVNGKPASITDSELMPPSDEVWYEPRCQDCFIAFS